MVSVFEKFARDTLFYEKLLWNNSIINNPLHDIEKSVSLLDLEIDESRYDADMAKEYLNTSNFRDYLESKEFCSYKEIVADIIRATNKHAEETNIVEKL